MPDNTEFATAAQAPRPPLVLFDGSCPLCSREIGHYRGLRGADRIRWLDIAADDAPASIDGIDRATALARFHVRDPAGRWHSGAHGFAELWSHLRGYRHLSRLIRTLGLVPLLDRLYAGFTRWRMRNRCDAATCTNPAGGSTQRNKP